VSEWFEDGYYDVCFSVERARRYHAKMQAFYDGCYNLTRVATALTGTASFFSLISGGAGTYIAKWLTGVVAAAATLDQVFRFNRKARTHEALARRFTDLSSKMPVGSRYLKTSERPVPNDSALREMNLL